MFFTLWTFLFAHGFLKETLQRQRELYDTSAETHVYQKKIQNLIGIFGALLAVNLFSWFSYVFPPVFYALIGDDVGAVPVEIDASLFIFSFFNTVANPILQMYFRPDIHKSFKKLLQTFKRGSIVKRKSSRNEGKSKNEENLTNSSVTGQFSMMNSSTKAVEIDEDSVPFQTPAIGHHNKESSLP